MNEKRIFDFCLWLTAGVILLVILTACTPAIPTAASQPTATITEALTVILPTTTPSPQAARCTVTTGYSRGALNIRQGPGTGFAVIRVLQEGEKLNILNRAAWLEVIDAAGNRGFVNSKFCK